MISNDDWMHVEIRLSTARLKREEKQNALELSHRLLRPGLHLGIGMWMNGYFIIQQRITGKKLS